MAAQYQVFFNLVSQFSRISLAVNSKEYTGSHSCTYYL